MKVITAFLLTLFILVVTNIIIAQSDKSKWENSGFKNVEYKEYAKNEFSGFTHALDLTLVNLRGSGWTEPLIRKNIKRVAEVYAQIGIKIENVKYFEVDPPYGRVDISDEKDEDVDLAKLLPTSERPVVFFIKSNIEGDTAFAWRFDSADPPLADTAFITIEINTQEYINKRQKGYSTTAHELTHILCDCDHIEGKSYNILSRYWNRVNSSFTKEQIRAIKNSPLLRKL